ncbi:MAG: RNA polymerase-associated protein RapA [Arenicellales bacterium]
MADFIPGQRWINDAQLQMGLGTVVSTDFRTVTIIFMAVGESFVYAKESVPLTRVRFAPGDHILTQDEEVLEVTDVREQDALLTYVAQDNLGAVHEVEESALNNFIQLNRPTERLFNGQIDRDAWFELRYKTQLLKSLSEQDPLRGLTGSRIGLIPHQLYIANEVANRYAPRVLLADEVGLGKTIEAGMIIHHQLVTERAQRVLIVVPESLVHQWLVEMLRRFNLRFRIFDADRMEALTAQEQGDETDTTTQAEVVNPFHTEQLVLCSLDFLCSRPDYYKLCRDGSWDLLVLDEAHHLEWSEQEPGFEYQLVEQLASGIKGILLLTATPEQLGKSSHFARLRLLDPQRFPDFQSFVKEEAEYEPVAKAVEALLDDDTPITNSSLEVIGGKLGEQSEPLISILKNPNEARSVKQATVDRLVDNLVDRHGTGRVLFRNTRAAVKGFPKRIVHDYPLQLPQHYAQAFTEIAGSQLSEMQLLLCPELLYQVISDGPEWTAVDPRVQALAEVLQLNRRQKVLVIAASADTALDLAGWFRDTKGINAAVFHEGMSLIERDRAAAYFADQISGSRVLICSEIGSEGRNFQFSHHLVLFDLPLNPDLLEQRIGRLDRIGQTETIHVHVLYIQDTAQEIMYRWYQEGLNAFSSTCPVGHAVFARVQDALTAALHFPERDYRSLIDESAAHYRELTDALRHGRDRLLEYNSCRPLVAERLRALALEHDQSSTLQQYMETVFDCFGVEHEIHSEGCYAINAGTHLAVPFPQLPEDGLTVTYSRDIALSYEDVTYLSWDHPLVIGAMDLVQAGELGNTSVIAVPIDGVARGTIMLESVYILESASTDSLHSGRYLPPTAIRVFIDQTGKRLDHLPSYSAIDKPAEKLRPDMARRLVAARDVLLRKMVAASEKLANRLAPDILSDAVSRSRETLEKEIHRLEALIDVNPNVREEEIEFLRDQLRVVTSRLEQSKIRLDALRVIIGT